MNFLTFTRRVVCFLSRFLHEETGQMAPTIMTAMLLGWAMFLGAAVDMSNLWVHKYRAMTAARSACLAGAGDLAWAAAQGTAQAITNFQASPTGFPIAVKSNTGGYVIANQSVSLSGTCSTGTNNAICAYASANGYNTSSGASVSWTVSNVPPSGVTINPNSAGGIPSYTYAANIGTPASPANGVLPYLHVSVAEKVSTYLLSMFPYFHSPVTVQAGCDCGLEGSPGPEQSITAACPFNEWAYNPSEWQSVQAGQIRTRGNNFGYGDSASYVFFNCDDDWIDQSGSHHPWNYLSTLPNVTVDNVAMRQSVGNQETGAGHAVIISVALAASATPFTPQPCSYASAQPNIPGLIDWLASDYLVESVNKTATYLYEADTNPTYSPWRTQPPTWTESLPPSGYGYPFISNPDTSSQQYEPAIAFVATSGQPSSRWSLGADTTAILTALKTKRYFGFGWCFQGNGKRDFIGNPSGSIGSLTIYFHQGGTKVSTFANY